MSVSKDLEFKSVVMFSLYRISDATANAQSIQEIADFMWATINPFLNEDDHEKWRQMCTPMFGGPEEDFQISINKLQLISLVLYRHGVLPNRDALQNRKYDLNTNGKFKSHSGGGLKAHLLSDVQLKSFLMRHLILGITLSKARVDYGYHIDALWGILSPYVTYEDYELWVGNNMRNKTNPYQWNIEEVKICMDIMERADFLFQTGITDEPLEHENFQGD